MKTIEKKYHPWRYLFAHSHLDIGTGVAGTARVHYENANGPQEEVHEDDEDERGDDEWAGDESEESDEQGHDEHDYADEDDLASPLVAEKNFHGAGSDYDLNMGDWYQ